MAETENTASLTGIGSGTVPDRGPDSDRRRDRSDPDDFNPIAVATMLLRTTRAGALATIDRNTGHPFSSLVNVATDVDGSPLILISRLAAHTANLEADPRASVLLAAAGKGDPIAHPRLTVVGVFRRIACDTADDARARRRFLSRHPKSQLYARFDDFAFWRLHTVSAHLNGGFARAADLRADDILTGAGEAAAIAGIEESTVAHVNAGHAAAVRLCAARLLGEADGDWVVTGIDPDGIDLALGDRIARLPFAGRVTNGHALCDMLAALAARAETDFLG
jgi:putative heme iron utilization protein